MGALRLAEFAVGVQLIARIADARTGGRADAVLTACEMIARREADDCQFEVSADNVVHGYGGQCNRRARADSVNGWDRTRFV